MNLCWATLSKLKEQYGDSYYLLDIDAFERNIREFLEAVRSSYANTTFGYSYKTNYIPLLCRRAYEMGAYAEVVSRFEYDLAIKLGASPERILFNGPAKSYEDLLGALTRGSIVNLDSESELVMVQQIAERNRERHFNIGIRCNFDLGSDRRSRFGFDFESGHLQKTFNTISQIPNCSIRGIHCHYSHFRDAASYNRRAKKMIEICRLLFPDAQPDFIDLGGGFCGKMEDELKQQFTSPISDYQDYADAICPEFASAFPQKKKPELILEPGMGIVADCMKFVAQVASTKRIGSHNFAVTTGCIYNIKPTLNAFNLPLQVIPNPSGADEARNGPWDLVGYTCMEIDRMYADYPGTINEGDFVVFGNTGAYTNVLKPPFIRGAPAILTEVNGNIQELRRPETLDDIMRTYT